MGAEPVGDGHPDAVLNRLALSCLEDVDELVERFVPHVLATPGYSEGRVPEAVVSGTAVQVFELLLRGIGGVEVPQRLVDVSSQIGRDRAITGIPLDSLLRAVRFDFRVVWQALLDRAGPEDQPALLAGAYRVWEAVEGHALGVMTGYQDAVLEMARSEEDERRRWFARLLETDGKQPDVLSRAATVLGVDLDAQFVVVVAPGRSRSRLAAVHHRLLASGITCHRQPAVAGDILCAQLPQRRVDVAADWCSAIPCAISPEVTGFAQVPVAVRLATTTSQLLTEEREDPLQTRDVWLQVAALQLPDLAADLVLDVLGRLDALDAGEAARISETLSTYLHGAGSLSEAAGTLYVHRNTVINRLRRFEELTGRNVHRPEDAAVVLLALSLKAAQAHPRDGSG